MARKRQRKKKRNRGESLQVELLGEAEAPFSKADPEGVGAPDAASGAEPSGAEPTSGDTEDATPPPEPREGGNRWAKAVGQLEPTRKRASAPSAAEDATPPHDSVSGREAADEAALAKPGGASSVAEPERRPDGRDGTAHDHASAPVRPAGEPLARARDLVRRGRVQEAIELYLGILTVNPSNLKAHNNLGVLFDELKRFEAALEHFEAAERLAPENVEVLVNYASTLTSLARYEAAEELLRRAQRLATEDARARLGIGILYFRRGLYAQAESELRWVLTKDDANGSAHYYRGESLNRLGRFEEAAEELRRAVELIPDDPRPYYTLGHLYDRQSRLEEAAEMYREARRRQAT